MGKMHLSGICLPEAGNLTKGNSNLSISITWHAHSEYGFLRMRFNPSGLGSRNLYFQKTPRQSQHSVSRRLQWSLRFLNQWANSCRPQEPRVWVTKFTWDVHVLAMQAPSLRQSMTVLYHTCVSPATSALLIPPRSAVVQKPRSE